MHTHLLPLGVAGRGGREQGDVWIWHFGRMSGKNHDRKSKIHTADAINEITSL